MKKYLLIFITFCFCNILHAAETSVVIIYSNNSNGLLENCSCPEHAYGALEKRAYIIDSIRSVEKNIILVDSGDILDIVSNHLLHTYITRAYLFMNYDAWVAGDQDFVEGPGFFLEGLLNLKMTFLNTNVLYNGNLLGEKYIIKQFEDVKIALTGTINPKFHKYMESESRKNFSIAMQEDNLEPVLGELLHECDFMVLISHSGMVQDESLARRFPEIDLIIGGHSQTLTKEPELVGETLIVQGGESGYRLGTLYLTFNGTKLVKAENRFILLEKHLPDHPEIVKLIKEYHQLRLVDD
jgi:2',3'-cyclic-nucleotide 2'-phosphodiesterase (5'-nucleotidase family)